MRATLDVDDALLARAQRLSGQQEQEALIHEALLALIQRESTRRFAQLAGSEPTLEITPRRQSKTK